MLIKTMMNNNITVFMLKFKMIMKFHKIKASLMNKEKKWNLEMMKI